MPVTSARSSILAVFGVVGAWFALKVHTASAWVIQVNQYGDTDYYLWSVRNAAHEGSVARWLTEYPTPAAWLLQVPYLLGADTEQGYRAAFMLMMALFDLAFLVFVLGRLGVAPAAAWILLTTLAGQLALLRLDIVPAVLAAAGLLLIVQGRTTASAPLLALGTATKLWPVLFFPLALGRKGERLRTTLVFAASGLLLAGVSTLGAGFERLLSPLRYQANRGLQVEAVGATLPMIRSLTNPGYEVFYSKFKAFEVTGPGVDTMLRITQVASVIAVVVVVGLLIWWFARGCPAEAAGYLGMLMVASFIATSKAYSPQYTIWLAALAVVVYGASRVDPEEHRPGRAWLVLALNVGLMLLTTVIYPTYYSGLVGHNEHSRFAVTVLAMRNGLLLVLITLLIALVADRLQRDPAAS